jgi:ribosomal protein S18 acetylase RimI-like enzyme
LPGECADRNNAPMREAARGDFDAIVETITKAFHNDPVWSWAFPSAVERPAQFTQWWGLFVGSALERLWVPVTPDCAAVALWVPPGALELTAADEARIEPLLTSLLGARAPLVLETLRRFEAAHPAEPPHYYLSFVATHTAWRGRGLGVGLLRESLARIDSEHMPAYLESSNPVNHERYRRLGFEPMRSFRVADDGPEVLQMWRDAR